MELQAEPAKNQLKVRSEYSNYASPRRRHPPRGKPSRIGV